MTSIQTTIGNGKAVVTVNYGTEEGVAGVLEVLLGTTNIFDALSEDQILDLEMECQADYDEQLERRREDFAIDRYELSCAYD
jgi:hypothetical protein